MFDWEDLKYFLAIGRAGSLSGAARLLHVDHATVSRRLNSLENKLQCRLFDRGARSCTLTLIGEHVRDFSIQIENAIFGIERMALAERVPTTGKVSISAPPVLVTYFLAKQLLNFQQNHPQIILSISSQPSLISLNRREADIALRLMRPTDNNDVAKRLGTLPFALYAHEKYANIDNPSLWEFIGYEAQFSNMPHAKWINSIAANRRLSCEVGDITSQHIAVKSGIGVASLPQFIGDADTTLNRLPYLGEAFAPEVWLVVHADMRHSPLLRIVMDFIIETSKEFLVAAK